LAPRNRLIVGHAVGEHQVELFGRWYRPRGAEIAAYRVGQRGGDQGGRVVSSVLRNSQNGQFLLQESRA